MKTGDLGSTSTK